MNYKLERLEITNSGAYGTFISAVIKNTETGETAEMSLNEGLISRAIKKLEAMGIEIPQEARTPVYADSNNYDTENDTMWALRNKYAECKRQCDWW